ncbi:protein kinase family protein [Rubripirellula reticaptiva]|uniref:Protein kinase domain-containing protein n=1 Tax=Rubripirellula reticaptiva TaxID=2528013 RepID=A0A5C6FC89_9BACT|nr:hypothetical protein [Rubripirellula reticaptiva]TWU57914.1 hypothetical protein Poly59_08230 [Rubripirellula reticaptiva]
MTHDFDWDELSINGMIKAVAQLRNANPHFGLAQLIGNPRIDDNRLVDLICIDLMHRRRIGQTVTVEEYVNDFPVLASESNLLDVIDAEVCVAKETGHLIAPEPYIARFPNLAKPIAALFAINEIPADLSAGSASGVIQQDDFSVDMFAPVADSVLSNPRLLTDAIQPPDDVMSLPAPNWFASGRCVAGEHGVDGQPAHWLFRGRDKTHGTALALKVVELPSLWSVSQTSQTLDICESASMVTHPAWVQPLVATVQDRYLAVIRPWIFARTSDLFNAVSELSPSPMTRNPLHDLATVAYSLASAHRTGATHGSVHGQNLLIDQQGQVRLVDAATGRRTAARWSHCEEGISTFSQRRGNDVDDLLKLIATTMVDVEPESSTELVRSIQKSIASDPDNPCATVGDTLMRWVDRPSSYRTPLERPDVGAWRRRARRWWIGRTGPSSDQR